MTKQENRPVTEIEYLFPMWAGYDSAGNDRTHHMHRHPDGTFIRFDGIRGFTCAAPLIEYGICSDPIPFNERQPKMNKTNLGSELDQGDQFATTVDGEHEIHEIIGFLIGQENECTMFTQVMNHPDGLHYVTKWAWKEYAPNGDNVYEIVHVSDYTILDMIVKGYK